MSRHHANSPGKPRTAIAAAEALETVSGDNAAADPPRAVETQTNGFLGLISEERLAAELNRSETTLRRWRKRGTGPPYVPVGRDIHYRIAAVEAWLIAREQGSPPPDDPVTPQRRRRLSGPVASERFSKRR
jgi:hypothetical protein